MQYHEKALTKVSRQFNIYGRIEHAEIFKTGHINMTYSATYNQGGAKVRYIHQKINGNVFKDPIATMSNVARVTEHILKKLEEQGSDQITRRCLILIPTCDGKTFYFDGDDYWRTFIFIEGIQTFESIQTPKQAYCVGQAFGRFQVLVTDLPGTRLHDTIPDFHNTPSRFLALDKVIETDRYNRVAGVRKEIDFTLKYRKSAGVIVDAMAKGKIPERITHNDTKLNNIMFDIATGQALCVVDLDTVMPGCSLYDFGDMIRTTTNPTAEDEIDLARVSMSMPVFKKLAEGYYSSVGSFLTKTEKDLMAFSGKLITLELGIRFLTDHLSGDTYFRVHRPNHNLDRCRTQFKLVESIEEQEKAMQKYVNSL